MHSHFSLETKQAARIASTSQQAIYTALQRHGTWEGIKPRKLPSGRLLWPRDEVLRVAGFVPEGGPKSKSNSNSTDIRVWLAFLDSTGLPTDDPTLQIAGARLLNERADLQRDASYALDELALLWGFVQSFTSRLDQVFHLLTPADQRHALRTLQYINQTLTGLVASDLTNKGAA